MKSYAQAKGRNGSKSAAQSAEKGSADKSEFARNFPALYKFLADLRKGELETATGTILLFAEQGYLKLNIRDRPEGRSGWVTAAEFSDALRIADTQLRTGTVRWSSKGYKRTANRRLFE